MFRCCFCSAVSCWPGKTVTGKFSTGLSIISEMVRDADDGPDWLVTYPMKKKSNSVDEFIWPAFFKLYKKKLGEKMRQSRHAANDRHHA